MRNFSYHKYFGHFSLLHSQSLLRRDGATPAFADEGLGSKIFHGRMRSDAPVARELYY